MITYRKDLDRPLTSEEVDNNFLEISTLANRKNIYSRFIPFSPPTIDHIGYSNLCCFVLPLVYRDSPVKLKLTFKYYHEDPEIDNFYGFRAFYIYDSYESDFIFKTQYQVENDDGFPFTLDFTTREFILSYPHVVNHDEGAFFGMSYTVEFEGLDVEFLETYDKTVSYVSYEE